MSTCTRPSTTSALLGLLRAGEVLVTLNFNRKSSIPNPVLSPLFVSGSVKSASGPAAFWKKEEFFLKLTIEHFSEACMISIDNRRCSFLSFHNFLPHFLRLHIRYFRICLFIFSILTKESTPYLVICFS